MDHANTSILQLESAGINMIHMPDGLWYIGFYKIRTLQQSILEVLEAGL